MRDPCQILNHYLKACGLYRCNNNLLTDSLIFTLTYLFTSLLNLSNFSMDICLFLDLREFGFSFGFFLLIKCMIALDLLFLALLKIFAYSGISGLVLVLFSIELNF